MARVEFPFGTKYLHNLLIMPNGFALKKHREEALRCTDCLKHTENWKMTLHPAAQVSATVLDECNNHHCDADEDTLAHRAEGTHNGEEIGGNVTV